MIDGISFKTAVSAQWLRNIGIDFYPKYNRKKRKWVEVGRHRGFILEVETLKNDNFSNEAATYELTVRGSLHKDYFGHNYGQFTSEQQSEEIEKIMKELKLFSHKCTVHSLEVGVNFNVKFSPIEYLDKNLIAYKSRRFKKYYKRDGNSIGYHCDFDEYKVKFYDKSLQYGLPENVLRFEVKFEKMKHLKYKGIKTLSDLKNPQKTKKLLPDLHRHFLLVEVKEKIINSKNIPAKTLELLRNGSKLKYWEKLKTELPSSTFYYRRGVFRKAQEKFCVKSKIRLQQMYLKLWLDNVLYNGSLGFQATIRGEKFQQLQ